MYHWSPIATFGFKMGSWWCRKIKWDVWTGNSVHDYVGDPGNIKTCLNVAVSDICQIYNRRRIYFQFGPLSGDPGHLCLENERYVHECA